MSNHTHIKEDDLDIWVCNNCGSYANTIDKIKHYKTCVKGEADYWEKHYEEMSRWEKR